MLVFVFIRGTLKFYFSVHVSPILKNKSVPVFDFSKEETIVIYMVCLAYLVWSSVTVLKTRQI